MGNMAIPHAECNRESVGDWKSGNVPGICFFGAALFLCLVVQLYTKLLFSLNGTLTGKAKEFRPKM
jgi:hypothetical protein